MISPSVWTSNGVSEETSKLEDRRNRTSFIHSMPSLCREPRDPGQAAEGTHPDKAGIQDPIVRPGLGRDQLPRRPVADVAEDGRDELAADGSGFRVHRQRQRQNPGTVGPDDPKDTGERLPSAKSRLPSGQCVHISVHLGPKPDVGLAKVIAERLAPPDDAVPGPRAGSIPASGSGQALSRESTSNSLSISLEEPTPIIPNLATAPALTISFTIRWKVESPPAPTTVA